MQPPISGTCSGTPVDTSLIGSRTADTVLKSSWIRRLKPRDEREHMQGSSAETGKQNLLAAPSESLCALGQVGELTSAEGGQGTSMEEVADLKSSEFAASLQGYASAKPDTSEGDREKSSSKSGIPPDASIHVLNKQNDDSADRQSNRLAADSEGVAKQFRERGSTAASRSGFGPWINVCSSSRLAEKSQSQSEISESNSKHVPNGFAGRSFSNSLVAIQYCGERANGISGSGPGSVQSIPPVAMGKPPLPPARSGTSGRGKLGLLLRPIRQKPDFLPFLPSIAAPSPSGKSIPMSDRDISHSHLLGHPLQTSINREGMSIEGTGARAGASVTVTKPSKEACPDGKNANAKEPAASGVEKGSHLSVITAARVDHYGVMSENHESVLVGKAVDFLSSQQPRLYSQPKSGQQSAIMPPPSTVLHVAKPWKFDKRESHEGMDAPVKGMGSVNVAKDATSRDLSSKPGVTDLHLVVSRPENEKLEFDKTGEAASRTVVRELKGNSLQPSPSLRGAPVDLSESSHGTANIDKADGVALEPPCSASSTANFPCEMFVEAAGLPRKARDQFVEMYNRARAELKNQRTSHTASRVPGKEMDNSTRLMSGQGARGRDVPPHNPERQSLEGHLQLVGYLQSEGKLTAMNGTSEHNITFSGVDVKALNVHAQEQERPVSGQQGISLPEGKVQSLHERKAQTFWATLGADGRAGPASETGHHVNAPAVLSVESALNTLERSPGDHLSPSSNPTLSQGTDDFKEDHLLPLESQSSVNPKAPPERENYQNKYWKRNLDQRSDVVKHITCKAPRIEGNMHSQSRGFLRWAPAMKYKHPGSNSQEFSLSKGLSQVAVESDYVRVREHAAPQLLGKRPRGVCEDSVVSATCAGIAGKRSADGVGRSSGGPHVWLQRWHPTYHNAKSTQGHAHLESNGVKDSLGGFSLSMVNSKNSDGCRLHDKTKETSKGFTQKVTFEKDRGFEYIQSNSEKNLPSAAAMAIVGTAARQFCSAQPRRKGYFAFWSGFGMPEVQKSEILKGKGKV